MPTKLHNCSCCSLEWLTTIPVIIQGHTDPPLLLRLLDAVLSTHAEIMTSEFIASSLEGCVSLFLEVTLVSSCVPLTVKSHGSPASKLLISFSLFNRICTDLEVLPNFTSVLVGIREMWQEGADAWRRKKLIVFGWSWKGERGSSNYNTYLHFSYTGRLKDWSFDPDVQPEALSLPTNTTGPLQSLSYSLWITGEPNTWKCQKTLIII